MVYAALTEAGAERVDAASCDHVGSIRSVLEEHLTESELDALAEMLEQLPAVVEAEDACSALTEDG